MEDLKSLIAIGREKKEIRSACRQWITSLLWGGYTRRFLRDRLTYRFFSEEQQTKTLSVRLDEFFSEFVFASRKYTAKYAVSRLFMSLTEPCRDLEIEVISNAPIDIPSHALERMTIQNGRSFAVLKNISSLDPFSARKTSEEMLSLVSDVFSLFHHTEPLFWSDNAWIVDEETNSSSLLGAPRRPVTRVIDASPKKAAYRMHKAINEFSLNEDAIDQFNRVVSLHGAALRTTSTNVQLLNLWTALEAIIPTSMSGVRIKSVITTLSPFLLLSYPASVVDDLLADIYRHDVNALKKSLKAINRSGRNQARQGLTEILFLPDASEVRNNLLNSLSTYPLLHNRFHVVAERFRNPEEIKKTLEAHERKVAWQIRRIYRTRNLYIHSGRRVHMIDTLVENAHYYLDIYLDSLLRLSRLNPPIVTLDQAWIVASERNREWNRSLSSTSFTRTNLVDLVLGPIGNKELSS